LKEQAGDVSRREPAGSSEESLIRQRLEKLDKLRARGINPFPAGSELTHSLGEVLRAFGSLKPEDFPDPAQGPKVETAGRLMTRRDMGKASFGHLRSGLSNLQIYLRSDVLGPEAYGTFLDLVDLGDILGVAESLVADLDQCERHRSHGALSGDAVVVDVDAGWHLLVEAVAVEGVRPADLLASFAILHQRVEGESFVRAPRSAEGQ
jgi:hypothetical protein